MNSTGVDVDVPIFSQLPPVVTIVSGLILSILAMIIVCAHERGHQARSAVPINALRSALSSGIATFFNARIVSTNTHDPFTNLSFATTHLQRRVYHYTFQKATYREYYLFNKKGATDHEKLLMARKKGNGDSRVRMVLDLWTGAKRSKLRILRCMRRCEWNSRLRSNATKSVNAGPISLGCGMDRGP